MHACFVSPHLALQQSNLLVCMAREEAWTYVDTVVRARPVVHRIVVVFFF